MTLLKRQIQRNTSIPRCSQPFPLELFYHFTSTSNSEPTLFFFHKVEKTHLIVENKKESFFSNFSYFDHWLSGDSAPETRSGALSKPNWQTLFVDHPWSMESCAEIENGPVGDVENTIFVAVGKSVEKSKTALFWAVKNFSGKRVCVLHVHQPENTYASGKFVVFCIENWSACC